MGHSPLKIEQEHYKVPKKAKTFTWALIGIGLVLSIIGFFTIPRDNGHHNSNGDDHATVNENIEVLKAGVQDEAGQHGDEHQDASSAHGNDNSNSGHNDEHQTTEGEKHAESHGDIVGYEIGTPIDCGIAGCEDETHNHAAHAEEHHAKPWYTQVWTALLANSYYILLISLGGLFFYCVQYVANAGWATTLLRIPQGMYSFFIIPAAVVMLVVFFGGDDMYHWIHYQHLNLSVEDPGFDKILDGKKWFLNSTFLFGVVPVCMVVWYIIGMRLKALSKMEEEEGGTKGHFKSIRSSAAFMVIFGFTFSFLAWLVIMSLDAHWFSTIFGIYHFATLWVCSLSVIMLITLHLRKNGYMKTLREDHIHDLGKFMFAFSVFWMYIWVAQYLLIWYANIPEESMYYTIRRTNSYDFFFIANVVINFVIPFLLFMTRDGKRNPKIITFVAISILIGHWIDMYLGIYPGAFNGEVVYPGLLEIGLFLLFAGIFIKWTLNAISKRGIIPINHPFIEESATHDVGV